MPRQVVHDDKQVDAKEATQSLQRLMICTNLCDTSVGKEEAFVPCLKLPADTYAYKSESHGLRCGFFTSLKTLLRTTNIRNEDLAAFLDV